MKNAIQKIRHKYYGEIRTVILNGTVYFMGKDVASTLGFKDTGKAIRAHVSAADKKFIKPSDLRVGDSAAPMIPNNGAYFINESGLYSLVMRSKLPQAQDFQHWLTSEVIPQIMKTGSYTLPEVQTADDLDTEGITKAVFEETVSEVREEMNAVFKVEPLMKLLDYTGNQKIRDRLIIKIAEKILGEKLF